MRKRFELGEKVVVYDGPRRYIGYVRRRDPVVPECGGGYVMGIEVSQLGRGQLLCFHSKQCRRLVAKKPPIQFKGIWRKNSVVRKLEGQVLEGHSIQLEPIGSFADFEHLVGREMILEEVRSG